MSFRPFHRLLGNLALSLVTAFASLALAVPLWAAPSDNTKHLVDNLVRVAFGSEFSGEDSERVQKWTGPLRVAVYGSEADKYREAVAAHLAKLRRLTGLDIALVGADDPQRNGHVFFIEPARFRDYVEKQLPAAKSSALPKTLACLGVFSPNANHEIESFLALIPTGLSVREANACIVEEITQVLGLPNDGDDIAPSIFNDDGKYLDLTWQDELFLRVLYDSRVHAGMSRVEFTALATQIIDQQRSIAAVAQKPQP
jgi:hypothetical protein